MGQLSNAYGGHTDHLEPRNVGLDMSETINVAHDFSPYPAGRYRTDGPWNGEKFREDYLLPALKRGPVTIVLDGVAGLPSSFFEEAIGGLIRSGLSLDDLAENLRFEANSARMKGYPEQAKKYLLEAHQKIGGKNR